MNSLSFLRNRELPFTVKEISKDDGEALALSILEDSEGSDPIYSLAEGYYLGGDITEKQFIVALLPILYQVAS
jgi:hypothetical protein